MADASHLLLRRRCKDAAHKDAVRHNLKPGIREPGRLGGPQDVQHVAVRRQHLLENGGGLKGHYMALVLVPGYIGCSAKRGARWRHRHHTRLDKLRGSATWRLADARPDISMTDILFVPLSNLLYFINKVENPHNGPSA